MRRTLTTGRSLRHGTVNLSPEVLESRLNLSAFGGQIVAPAVGGFNPLQIVGLGAKAKKIQAGFGGTTPLGSGVTSVAVNSYTAISNCGYELQPGQTQGDIGFVKKNGAYVEYTVTAATAGSYALSLGLASYGAGAQVQVLVNGTAQGTITAAATNSWTVYFTGTTTVQLAAGTNVIRLAAQNGTQYNINQVSLDATGSKAPAVPTTTVGDNTTLDLTTYSSIWHMGMETQNGKPDVAFVSSNGAYVEYTIDVQTAGTYTLTTGLADVAPASLNVTSNGAALTSYAAGNTGSWGNFVSYSQNVTLSAGVQTLRFTSTNNTEYNIGSVQLVRQGVVPPAGATVSQRWMTSFNEIDVVGTSGNDSIYVTQSGSTLTITSNGQSQQVAANGELVIWGGDGNDTITVDSSVTLDTRMYGGNGNNTLQDSTKGQGTIVSIGGGNDTLTGNKTNTSFWADNADAVNASAAEKALGGVHTVTGFYGGASTTLNGPNLTDPASTGAGWTRLTNSSMFGLGAVQEDVNQGQVSDCYFLTALQSTARLQPASLRQMGVDLGDGTYAIQFKRGGVTTYVRVDGDLPTASWGGLMYAHLGGSGNQWVEVFEKAYAFFRTGSASYSSLNFGFSTNAYNDLGVAATTIGLPTDQNSFYTLATGKLSAGKAMDIGTYGSITNGAPLIGNHAYAVTNVWKDGAGTVWVTLRNPWGFDGFSQDANPWDGMVTMSYAVLLADTSFATVMS